MLNNELLLIVEHVANNNVSYFFSFNNLFISITQKNIYFENHHIIVEAKIVQLTKANKLDRMLITKLLCYNIFIIFDMELNEVAFSACDISLSSCLDDNHEYCYTI